MSNAVMESVLKLCHLSRGLVQESSKDESHLESAFLRLDEQVRTGGANNLTI